MGYTNASEKVIKKGSKKARVAVNSLQTTAYVKRIAVNKLNDFSNHYKYDIDDLYPQKIISIKERSWALSSATKTLSDFITGDGFTADELNKLIVNSEGLTGYDLLREISNQKSQFGFSLHVNYSIQGLVTEINRIDFEDLRVSKKNTLLWAEDWSEPYSRSIVEYNRFNPENVKNEIKEAGGIENYKGQVLYWTGTNKIYPLSTFDAALDSGQYQAENELFKLRNIQNDFAGSGALTYPMNLDNTTEWEEVKQNILQNGIGADNASRVFLFPKNIGTGDSGGNQKVWESFERKGVDKLFETQNKEAKETIFSVLRQPQILGGVNPAGGWPNAQEMEDAFTYYNSIVEQDRKEVEKTLKKIFDASIWDVKEVVILPKMLIKNEGTGKEKEVEETNIVEDGIE